MLVAVKSMEPETVETVEDPYRYIPSVDVEFPFREIRPASDVIVEPLTWIA